MRKLYSKIVILAILTAFPFLSKAQFSGTGSGTEANPYIITTATQLDEMRNDLAAWYQLGNDIDLDSFIGSGSWSPIGSTATPFTGKLNGGNHVISNLRINDPSATEVGLFGFINASARVHNLGITGASITAAGTIGIVAGSTHINSEVFQVWVQGSITATADFVGGISGSNFGAINQVAIDVNISSTANRVGGVTGLNGIIGSVSPDGAIRNFRILGNISGNNEVGGVVGLQGRGVVQFGLVMSKIEATGSSVGFLVGARPEAATLSNVGAVSSRTGVTNAGADNSQLQSVFTLQYDQAYQSFVWNLIQLDLTTIWDIDNAVSLPHLRFLPTAAPTPSDFYLGSGTELDPYLLYGAVDMPLVQNNMSAHFKVMAPINFGQIPYASRELSGTFSGVFDGNNSSIQGFSISVAEGVSESNIGFFPTNTGTIKNLFVSGTVTAPSSTNVGIVTGNNQGTMSKVQVRTSTLSGADAVGGVAGINTGTISTSYAQLNSLTGGTNAGGLVGQNGSSGTTGSIEKAFGVVNSGSATNNLGSLVGNHLNGSISVVYGSGRLSLSEATNTGIGAIVGVRDASATLTSAYGNSALISGGNSEGTMLNAAEMMQAASFVGFDFTTDWDIVENDRMPFLRDLIGTHNYKPYSYPGAGNLQDPHLVSTLDDLRFMGLFPNRAYRLENDITIPDYGTNPGFLPIGTESIPFTGNFNGNNKTISDLWINRPDMEYVGLFGYVGANAQIYDVKIAFGWVRGESSVGLLAGIVSENASINRVVVDGSVNSVNNNAGGIAGVNFGNIAESHANVQVNSTGDNVGGIVGWSGITGSFATPHGNVTDVWVRGTVNGVNNVGGIVGLQGRGWVQRSYSHSQISGTTNVGGGYGRVENQGSATFVYFNSTRNASIANGGATGIINGNFYSFVPFSGFNFFDTWDYEQGVTSPTLKSIEDTGITVATGILGDGTSATPYLITSGYEMNFVRERLSSQFSLQNDITLSEYNSGTGWQPIGNASTAFSGVFNGNGYTISNMQILFVGDTETSDIGLFGMNAGVIRNVGLSTSSISANSGDRMGMIAGNNLGTIEKVWASVSLVGRNDIGGLVGSNQGILRESFANISSTSFLGNNGGGLIGSSNTAAGDVTNNFVVGSGINGNNIVGGLIGYLGGGDITNSYVSVRVNSAGTKDLVVGGIESSITTPVSNIYINETKNLGETSSYGTELGVVAMHTKASFTGFSFTDTSGPWDINDATKMPFLPNTSSQSFSAFSFAGQGTSEDPYQVATALDLFFVRNFLDAHFLQTAEINLSAYSSGEGWEPIGDDTNPFSGVYNANSHAITGLRINRPSATERTGLFGTVIDGNVTVILKDAHVIGNESVGAVAGLLRSNTIHKGQIINSFVEARVEASGQYVGGVVGVNYGLVSKTAAHVQVLATGSFVGGIGGLSGVSGTLPSGNFANVSVSGSVQSSANSVGGIVGWQGQGSIVQTISLASVSGTSSVGAIVGTTSGGGITLTQNFWSPEYSGGTPSSTGTSLTSEQMLNRSNFPGLDFTNVWDNKDGAVFPHLRNVEKRKSGIISLSGTGDAFAMIGSPTQTTYAEVLAPIWTQGAIGADTESASPNVFVWSASDDREDASGWVGVDNLNNQISDNGLLVFVYENDNPNAPAKLAGESEESEIQNVGYTKKLPIKGEEKFQPSISLNNAMNGWTLVGNPYFSDISWNALVKFGITPTVHVWNMTDGWKSYNGSVGTLTDGIIPIYSAFFVKTNATDFQGVQFPYNDVRVSGTQAKEQEEESDAMFKLAVEGQAGSNATIFHFHENGVLGLDDYDADKLHSLHTNFVHIYSVVEGKALDINSLPSDFGTMELDLEVNSNVAGEYKLSFPEWNIPNEWEIVFVDEFTSTETVLTAESSISVSVSAEQSKSKPDSASVVNDVNPTGNSPYKLRISSSTTTSNEDHAIAHSYELLQNYPNPFNPSTVISFSLPQQENVRLRVMDMLGREITVLVNGNIAAGKHSVTWDASSMASGIYFYRLETSLGVISKKMTLVK